MFKIYKDDNVCIYDDTITDATKCLVRAPNLTMEANKAGMLTFTASPGLSIQRNDHIYITKTKDGVEDIYWAGRVLSDDRGFYNDKEIEVEGALALLNDSLQPASNRSAGGMLDNINALIDWHNDSTTDDRRYEFEVSDTTKNANYSAIIRKRENIGSVIWKTVWDLYFIISGKRTRETTLQNFQQEFIDQIGGQLKSYPKWVQTNSGYFTYTNVLDYIDAFDTENRLPSQQTIEFGKNLVSITRKASIEDLATVYVPEGRALEEYEKAWPYIQKQNNGKYRIIELDPNNYTEGSYRWHSIINSDTGSVTYATEAAFAVCQDIPVYQGEKYFLTTYLEGPSDKVDNSYVGALAYAVVMADGTLVSSGGQARNTKDSQTEAVQIGKVNLVNQLIDIPYLEGVSGSTTLYLRIARKVITPEPEFILKKFNKYYGETNLTVMSHAIETPTTDYPVGHSARYDLGADVYPIATSTAAIVNGYEHAKQIYNYNLTRAFGMIAKVYSNPNCETVADLYREAVNDLKKMDEKVELEIQAVDLSYLDPTLPSFELLDLVQVISPPHGIDLLLPIMKIELPLDSPEKAIYTLQNDVEIDKKSPKYVSKYMAETYQKI